MTDQPAVNPRLVEPSTVDRRGIAIAATVLGLAIALWVLRLRGVDYPAQIFRVDQVRRHGLSLWNANWYGGHYTPGYGIVLPWLASYTGLAIPAVVSTVGSVVLFERLLTRSQLPHVALGTSAFAFLMLVNMYEGRLPFGLGVLLGLLAVALARNERWWLAAGAVMIATLASPVAGAFTALALAAWGLSLTGPRWRELVRQPPVRIAAFTLVTTLIVNVLFPEGGFFPFLWLDAVLTVAAGILVWHLLPTSLDAVRWGFAIVAFLAVPIFFIANPLGGNLGRLAVIGAPILCAAPRKKTALHAVVCLTLLGWQAKPLLHLPEAANDPSAQPSYYQPLVAALRDRTDGPVRIEIPFTEDHWEAAYVAPAFPLARGWERQIDLRYNDILYSETLSTADYQDWLIDNGVSYVAIPDTDLEVEAQREAAIALNASYLHKVWHNDHWQLFQVRGTPGLITGPARLVKMTGGTLRLSVEATGPIDIRMRYTRHLVVVAGRGCLSESADGWTTLEAFTTGPVKLRTELFAAQRESCDPG
ncbi:MAG: hypothetical protein ABJA81_01260 [Nocardioidaceae bacterium]